MQNSGASLALVGAERRLLLWFVIYAAAVVGLFTVAFGDLVFAVGLIVLTELIFMTIRPQPNFGASTYRPPAPDGWQLPITALRWAWLAENAWAIASGAVVLSITALISIVILGVMAWNHELGVGNLMVLVLYGAWLSTRRLWVAPLRQALKREVASQFGRYLATVYVGTEGVTIDLRHSMIQRSPERSYRFTVNYAELDEVRMMDGLTAQGYLASMAQYDPTFTVRTEWEFARFSLDQRTRPTVVAMSGVGAQLLLRSPTLFYMVGNADQFGPAAVAAWQTWRTAHPSAATTSSSV
ncbi:MAG TPA: hypothetical protein VHO95_06565 [Candidatus Dormibacteraeota bacterium]|nr:hypothetical protein [Candidatus Dormibacteraeota bacterium]HEX2681497.1 hypothetical protein [Candidatus Dormibacteraeota bacterium]